ncbi:MAG: ethanolamine ammonia-lyase reactivating factor EutA [Desulfobacter sp.]|nr:MAG: ethanolamine ammonia-lyase reactivating factor EutA [Desulfobacter sp.]
MEDNILSVGIDIGTSTTQLVFSQIKLQNMANVFSVPRITIMEKELVFTSDIHETPLVSAKEIDGPKVRSMVEAEYTRAGITPDQVGTGAVIITGETARKSNAAQVLDTLSGLAGEFVVATAGPALEGIIAGKGAGAHTVSKERGAVVANLDIGGGTTNIAVFCNGEVIDTSCMDIGGRLVKFSDRTGKVSYASKKAQLLARSLGISLEPGQVLTQSGIHTLAQGMAGILEQSLGTALRSRVLPEMATDKLLKLDYDIDYITFSGGVAECMNQDKINPDNRNMDPFAFGDLGIYLGRALAASSLPEKLTVLAAKETIRATVVGAGSHTTSISGSTVTFAEEALPVQDVPVLKLSKEDEAAPYEQWADIISQKVNWFALRGEDLMPALAFKGPVAPGFDEIQTMARSIIAGMDAVMTLSAPLMVVVENDLAKALGQALRAQLAGKKKVICIDSVAVENGDYIDIGKGLANGNVVPVIVKTLVFGY